MSELPFSAETVCLAYSYGFFPMPRDKQIYWYKPDPRAIFPLDEFHVSKSLRRKINKGCFRISFDQDFPGVIAGCADREETWIDEQIIQMFTHMFQLGVVHSVEVWDLDDQLVGGVYGLHLGGAFFAESMFHRVTDASKIALYALVLRLRESGFHLLECQYLTSHLASLGAKEISSFEYDKMLKHALGCKIEF